MIQELKDSLEREKSKNKVLLQILEDTQKCITNGKKFMEDQPVILGKARNPFKREEDQPDSEFAI